MVLKVVLKNVNVAEATLSLVGRTDEIKLEWVVPVFAARPEAEWVKSWMEPDGVGVHAVHGHMADRVTFVSEAGVLYGTRGDPISPRLWCLLLPRCCASSLRRSRFRPPTQTNTSKHTCSFCMRRNLSPGRIPLWKLAVSPEASLNERMWTERSTGQTPEPKAPWALCSET